MAATVVNIFEVGDYDAQIARAREQLQAGVSYEAALRLRLDVNQLPKPFQVNALASREWTLQSEWHRFSFTA